MIPQRIAKHFREVQAIVDGGPSARKRVIRDSWPRCVQVYGLDPTDHKGAHIFPDGALRQDRERLGRLITTARYTLLYEQVAVQRCAPLPAGARGAVVDYVGDAALEKELRKAGLHLGPEWSESRAGTCAGGSCIHSGERIEA